MVREPKEGTDPKAAALYNTPITFIYVASVHNKIKDELMQEIEAGKTKSVTNNLEYLHVKEGSTTLPLPTNVEVIVLRKASLMALFGTANYVLLDSLAETKVMAEEEAQSTFKAFSLRTCVTSSILY